MADLFEAKTVRPMLAKGAEPFNSGDYLYEIKWDGIRCLAYLDGNTHLRSRNNLDISESYPELADMHNWIQKGPAILDGEIVIMKNGKPSFHEWQKRGRLQDRAQIQHLARINPAVYIVFDILYTGEGKIMHRPLAQRKEILQKTVTEQPSLVLSRFILKDGENLYKAAVGQGLEGVVAKKLDSPYLPGKRSSYWLKFRSIHEKDFVICGYMPGSSDIIGSLILGAYRNGSLVYQGTVGAGISGKNREYLLIYINEKRKDTYPFPVKVKELSRGIWLEPELVCAVEYLEKSEGGLRHPVFRGLRFDKNPLECLAEGEENA